MTEQTPAQPDSQPDTANTPVEELTETLEPGDDAAEKLAQANTIVAAHTDDALVLEDNVTAANEIADEQASEQAGPAEGDPGDTPADTQAA